MAGESVFISVADPSADANAALFVKEMLGLRPGVRAWGIGGPLMGAAGVALMEDTVAKATMGLAVVGRAWGVWKLLRRIRAAWKKDRPGLVVCIDSWSMNVHVARAAKARGIPVLYYVAPQTWASREGRVREMKRVIDRLACILPFEEEYFRGFGIAAEFVGHPLWDRVRVGEKRKYEIRNPREIENTNDQRGMLKEEEIVAMESADAGPVVAILPGSRRGVARANWPRLLAVMERIRVAVPGVRFVVPVTPNAAEVVLGGGGGGDGGAGVALPGDVETREGAGAMDELLPGCDLAICVSGTSGLHVAAHGVPMIVVYYGNRWLWHLIGRWLIRTRTFSLVNLLAGREGEMAEGRHVVPEYVPWYGPVDAVAEHAIRLLRSPPDLAAMRTEIERVVRPLAKSGASRRVAEIAAEMLGGGSSAPRS